MTTAADATGAAADDRRARAAALLEQAEAAARSRDERPRPEPRPGVSEGVRSDREPEPASVARAIVLRQLAMAPRSRGQLARTLARKGCDPEVAESVLDRMCAAGLVDDSAYARDLVRARTQDKGLARRGLANELRSKGVDKDIVDAAVAAVSEEQETAMAYEWAARRLRSMSGLDPEAQARRLAGFLARKGYAGSTVRRVVTDLVTNAEEHRRD